MAGTKAGGKKTAKANILKHGPDYYKELGRKGGSVSHPETRYFALYPEFASKVGKKGGAISKRGKHHDD